MKAYAALAKAEAAAKAASKANCDQYKMDKKGKCPGDTGYVSFVKEDVPQSFAVSHFKSIKSQVLALSSKTHLKEIFVNS